MFSMQGKRDNNEDRAVIRTVRMVEDIDQTEVHVWAVMDGHGGQFCADYCEEHLVSGLVTAIQKLKLLTSSLDNKKKLELYEKHYKEVSKGVLKYLQISETEYNSRQRNNTEKDIKRESSKDESDSVEVSEEEDKRKPSRSQLVLSSRNKSLEELPAINNKKPEVTAGGKTPQFTPKSKSRPRKFIKGKSKSDSQGAPADGETDITEFIKDGEILYPRLIAEEISKCDAKLLKEAKKTNNIGGLYKKVVLPSGEKLQIVIFRDDPDPGPA